MALVATLAPMNTTALNLTLEELLERTNRALAEWLPGGATVVPFNERTLRYYVSQGLLPKLGTRGPGARYPEAYVWRLLFIRRLQHERSLTLEQVRGTLEQVAPEVIERMARHRDPLEFGLEYGPDRLAELPDALAPMAAIGGGSPATPEPGGEAADYLQRNRHRFDPRRAAVPIPSDPATQDWQPVWRDARAEIRVHGDLTDAQRRQIENLGALLRSILED